MRAGVVTLFTTGCNQLEFKCLGQIHIVNGGGGENNYCSKLISCEISDRLEQTRGSFKVPLATPFPCRRIYNRVEKFFTLDFLLRS